MSVCKVHNVRFYKPKPKGIYCMAFQKDLKKLAVSRSDASIELWNIACSPFIETLIACNTENYSIEGLAWAKNRLFSVGLQGLLMEYDLRKLTIKKKTSVTGQAAFCLDVNEAETQIAIGTEQGYMNIFNITDDGAIFEKFLDKQEGRILCLKYDSTGNFIASGSVDAIRIWDVKMGNAIHKMTTGRAEANKSTIIWCLAVTQDFTIISGDSRGKLTFWDGKVGAQIESCQSHRSDVLSLCLSEDEKTLYCAGSDPNIMSYVKINVKGECHKWVKSIQRKVHDHDVRALALHDSRLYSGGIDGYLACSYHPPKTLMKYPPILQNPCAVVAADARYILLQYPKYIELWSLGESSDENSNSTFSTHLPLKHESRKLLILQRRVKSDLGKDKKEGIVMCSMSNDGKWIVFSTNTILRLFNFKYEGEKEPQLILNESLPEECGISIKAIFTPNSQQLFLITQAGDIQVVNVKSVPALTQTINTGSYFYNVISSLICSPCGQFLIGADIESNIAVWKYIEKNWKFYCKLPKYNHPPTALNVQPKTMNMVVVYSDHKIVEFNLYDRKLTPFSKELGDKNYKMFSKSFPIRNITFDPRNDKVIILHDDANIVILNKEKKSPKNAAKVRKIEPAPLASSDENESASRPHIHAIKKYKHLVHLGWLSNDEMVAVEVSPLTLLEQLPPGFRQNTFGTK